MPTVLRRATGPGASHCHPGEWYLPGGADWRRHGVIMRCPACECYTTLWVHPVDNPIADDGSVAKLFACPYACDFHDHVRLGGWDPAEGAKGEPS